VVGRSDDLLEETWTVGHASNNNASKFKDDRTVKEHLRGKKDPDIKTTLVSSDMK